MSNRVDSSWKFPKDPHCYALIGRHKASQKEFTRHHRLFDGKPSKDQLQALVDHLYAKNQEGIWKGIVWTVQKIQIPKLSTVEAKYAKNRKLLTKLRHQQTQLQGIRDAKHQSSPRAFVLGEKNPTKVYTYELWATGNGGQRYDYFYILSEVPYTKDQIQLRAPHQFDGCCQPEGYRGWTYKKIKTPPLKNIPEQLEKLKKEIIKAEDTDKLLSDLLYIIRNEQFLTGELGAKKLVGI